MEETLPIEEINNTLSTEDMNGNNANMDYKEYENEMDTSDEEVCFIIVYFIFYLHGVIFFFFLGYKEHRR